MTFVQDLFHIQQKFPHHDFHDPLRRPEHHCNRTSMLPSQSTLSFCSQSLELPSSVLLDSALPFSAYALW